MRTPGAEVVGRGFQGGVPETGTRVRRGARHWANWEKSVPDRKCSCGRMEPGECGA